MTNTVRSTLYRLADTTLRLADPRADIRGRPVLDAAGHEVGVVDDLMVDREERRVRFLQIGAGGFLGFGRTEFLVPVDVVARVSDAAVHIGPTRDDLVQSPRYNSDLVDEKYLSRLTRFYGHRPYWEDGYRYPGFPFFS